MGLVYIEMVPREQAAFEAAVRAIGTKYGFNPNWLMICMRFETAGQFLPGLYKSSGAVGLIQFTSAGASQVGTTKAYLATLTAVQQLAWVDKYFGAWKAAGKVNSLEDCYTVIFAPAYLGRLNSTVIHRAGTAGYAANKSLDIGNKGYITLEDTYTVIRRYDPGGYVETPTTFNLSILALLAGGYFLYNRSKKEENQNE